MLSLLAGIDTSRRVGLGESTELLQPPMAEFYWRVTVMPAGTGASFFKGLKDLFYSGLPGAVMLDTLS